jgi:putative chitinase
MIKILNNIEQSLFGGRLTHSQRTGIEFKLTAFKKHGVTDIRHQAYMLATSYHETAKTMQPIEEYGKGKGRPYGSKLKQNRKPYEYPDKIYYGRGDVQLTWYENYELMGRLLNIPLLEKPELALEPDISAEIMIEGMMHGKSNRGDFTGVSLETYFNKYRNDPVRARRVVNGLDQANKIAGYYYKFLEAMKI